MIGRRSPFCPVLSAAVSRCRREIAVCMLWLSVLISRVQYNTIAPCEAWCTVCLISHSAVSFPHEMYYYFNRSGRMTVANRHAQSDHLQFGVALGQLARPSAGVAPSHIWRKGHRLHGTTVWRRLTQQSRHLAGPCEGPAPVKQSQLAIRRRHRAWLSAASCLLPLSCCRIYGTHNYIAHAQQALPPWSRSWGNAFLCVSLKRFNYHNGCVKKHYD